LVLVMTMKRKNCLSKRLS